MTPSRHNTYGLTHHYRNCVLLRQYFDRLGGRDRLVQDVEDAGRKVSGKSARDEAPTPTETQQPAHMSSTAIPARPVGSWEKDISSIDGCEDKGGGNLVVYVTWKNGSKTRHGTSAMYEHCPQMVSQPRLIKSHTRRILTTSDAPILRTAREAHVAMGGGGRGAAVRAWPSNRNYCNFIFACPIQFLLMAKILKLLSVC